MEQHVGDLTQFVADEAARTGTTIEAVWQRLGQYGRTNGAIGQAIATHLARDEGIHVDPDDIVVTVGAQEAMAIVLAGLFDPREDILLASDPTYVGITGLATLFGIRVAAVAGDEEGMDPGALSRAIAAASRQGRVRALYDIPDFNNPLGTSLPVARRREILEICARHGVLVIEDNPYGMFAYDHVRLPTFRALDEGAQVLYIGSFAKTMCPGLRVGYLVANQRVAPDGEALSRALSRVKSLLTVNTPPLMQAIVAGVLRQHGGTLEPLVAPKRARYRTHRDALVAALEDAFAPEYGAVSWRAPAGGFFLGMTLPFAFGAAELRACAVDHGVIVCPMRFFCLGAPRDTQIRLSFSYVEPDTIARGIARLAAFVRARVAASPRA